MFRCMNCGWLTELDDADITTVTGKCICVRCYYTMIDRSRPMPAELRRDVEAALKGAS